MKELRVIEAPIVVLKVGNNDVAAHVRRNFTDEIFLHPNALDGFKLHKATIQGLTPDGQEITFYQVEARVGLSSGATKSSVTRRVKVVRDFDAVFNLSSGVHAIIGCESLDSVKLILNDATTTAPVQLSASTKLSLQKAISEIRDLIIKSTEIEENHRARLLSKLEALQRELHKEVSDLEKVFAFIGRIGMATGDFGKNAKPAVDRIVEIVRAVKSDEYDAIEHKTPDK